MKNIIELLNKFVTLPKDINLATPAIILKEVTDYFDAAGCIFWQEKQHFDLLFTKEIYLRYSSSSPVHKLPMNTITGDVIKTKQSKYIPSVKKEPRLHYTGKLEKFQLNSMVIVPIQFSGENQGAMTVYKNKENGFSEKEIQEIEQLANLLSGIYSAMIEKVYFHLLKKINKVFSKNHSLSSIDLPKIVSELCNVVSESFHCEETTIFFNLKDKKNEEGKLIFEVMGSTCKENRFVSKNYVADKKEGLTGYVLEHREAVRIFDLVTFDNDYEGIQKVYRGITSGDSLKMRADYIKKKKPLSFLAIPIIVGEELVGAIRCSGSKSSPYYFTAKEEELLKFISIRIGQMLVHWKGNLAVEKKNAIWEKLYETIKKTNNIMREEVSQKRVKPSRVYKKMLLVIHELIPEISNMDILRYDEIKEKFTIQATTGEGWNKENEKKVRTLAEVDGQIDEKVNQANPNLVFKLIKEKITFPIKSPEGKFLGMLNVRSEGSDILSKRKSAHLSILVEQLELYSSVLLTMADLDTKERQMRQTLEDLWHQLKSPVNYSYTRIKMMLGNDFQNEKLEKELAIMKGLLDKTEQVVKSTGLFARLAAQQEIKINTTFVSLNYLRKLFIEVALDSELTCDPDRNITFTVSKNFDGLGEYYFEADKELLRQAVISLVDNAGKYSFRNTEVTISADCLKLKDDTWVEIKVKNQGLKMTPEETKKAHRRNWRSSKAKITTAEGNGIGLWLTDHIMKSHKGDLVIRPTSPDYWNEISLMFKAELL